jgi:putative hemolysin
MRRKSLKIAHVTWLLALLGVLSGCTSAQPAVDATGEGTSTTPVEQPTPTTTSEEMGLPNPASVYCEEQGGTLEIQKDEAGAELGICKFNDGSQCEEWAFFRKECAPGDSLPTPPPAETARYTNTVYGFSINPSSDWAIEEYEDYLLFLRPGYKLFVGYQWANEEPRPFRTGMPQGDLVDGGTFLLLDQAVPKKNLVWEGKTKVVMYGGRLKAGNLVLVCYLDAVETPEISYQALDIPLDMIAEADRILASFQFISGEKPAVEFNP